MKRDYGIFYVGLKVLLRKGGDLLLLRTDDGYIDLPGGRIDNVEYRAPLQKIIAREIREELGPVRYKLGEPMFHFRRYAKRRGMHVFLAVYEGDYISGSIRLSQEHSSYQWIKAGTFPFTRRDFTTEETYALFRDNLKRIQSHA